MFDDIRKHEKNGRPWGGKDFLAKLEKKLVRTLAPQKPGLKAKIMRIKYPQNLLSPDLP